MKGTQLPTSKPPFHPPQRCGKQKLKSFLCLVLLALASLPAISDGSSTQSELWEQETFGCWVPKGLCSEGS